MKSLRRYLLAVLVGVATLCGSGVASSSSSLGDQVLVTPVESSSDFENIVLKSEKAWLVFLYDSSQTSKEDGDSSLKVLAKIAQVFREIVHTAAVDVRSEAGRKCAEESLSTPGFYFYGDNKTKAKKYEGRIDTQSLTEQLIQFLLEVLRSRAGEDGAGFNHSGRTQDKDKSRRQSQSGTSGIVELTDTNFDELVLSSPMVAAVAFTAPWCGHCTKLKPEWHSAATTLKGQNAILGWVDATSEQRLAGMFKVQSYPTIKMFPGGSKKNASDAFDYQGERSAEAIVEAVLREIDQSGVPKEATEMTSVQVLEDECSGSNHICVIAVLPHILDSGADGRNRYMELLQSVSKSFRGGAFSFLWFEGGSQPQLEEAMGLSFGYPAALALSLDKEAYAVMRGSFSEKGMSQFIHGLVNGRQRTIKLQRMPQVVTVTPWDGLDGAPIEDEIPLSEIMGWDDDDSDVEVTVSHTEEL